MRLISRSDILDYCLLGFRFSSLLEMKGWLKSRAWVVMTQVRNLYHATVTWGIHAVISQRIRKILEISFLSVFTTTEECLKNPLLVTIVAFGKFFRSPSHVSNALTLIDNEASWIWLFIATWETRRPVFMQETGFSHDRFGRQTHLFWLNETAEGQNLPVRTGPERDLSEWSKLAVIQSF